MGMRRRALGAAGLVAAALLTGCGDGPPSDTASSATTSTNGTIGTTGRAGAAGAAAAGAGCRDGRAAGRHYLLCLPAGGAPAPLVLALHGRGSSAAGMRAVTRLDRAAAAAGIAVLYVDALDGGWGDDSFRSPTRPHGDEDVSALQAVLAAVRRQNPVSPARVAAIGFSNGASMAMRLGAQRPDLVAAVVAVAGELPLDPSIRPRGPIPLMIVYGDADPLRPYRTGIPARPGRQPGGPTPTLSVPRTVQAWLGTSTAPVPQRPATRTDRDPGDGTGLVLDSYGTPAGRTVTLYTVTGGGHTWPGSPSPAPTGYGRVSRELDASQAAVDFAEPVIGSELWGPPTADATGPAPSPHDDAAGVGGDIGPHEIENHPGPGG